MQEPLAAGRSRAAVPLPLQPSLRHPSGRTRVVDWAGAPRLPLLPFLLPLHHCAARPRRAGPRCQATHLPASSGDQLQPPSVAPPPPLARPRPGLPAPLLAALPGARGRRPGQGLHGHPGRRVCLGAALAAGGPARPRGRPLRALARGARRGAAPQRGPAGLPLPGESQLRCWVQPAGSSGQAGTGWHGLCWAHHAVAHAVDTCRRCPAAPHHTACAPQWEKTWLESAGPGAGGTGAADALRHAMVLVNGSGSVVRLMIWATPMRIA